MAKKRTKKPARPIHQRIKTLRTEAGLSQRALAAKCGVDETAVSHWENGASAPNGNRLALVADALGVSVGELFEAA